MFQLVGFPREDVRVEGTIWLRLNDGDTFFADIKSWDGRGAAVYRSAVYPAFFPKP